MSVEINADDLDEIKKQLSAKNAFKVIFGTLISLGATAAVIALMKNPIKGAHGIVKILMSMGIFVVGCKVGDVAEDYFEEKVDDLSEMVKDIRNEIKEEGDENKNASDSESGRNSKQQSEKSNNNGSKLRGANNSDADGKAAGSAVWWRGWRKKKEAE